MEKGWGNLGEVEKLLEQGKERKAEPDIELLLAKNNGIIKLLFN